VLVFGAGSAHNAREIEAHFWARLLRTPESARKTPMKMKELTIADRMTKTPHLLGDEQTLSKAHEIMREHRIRHLPVLHGGKLVGVVSLRDLHLIETLRDVDPDEVTVEDAMTQDVYVVPPSALLKDVVKEMAERKLGSAVVAEGPRVVGVFTTVDALDTLADLLGTAGG
jgi:acetoin utilization protein AcuB